MEEAYRFSLKDEEKLARKSQAKIWGSFIGRGSMRGRGNPKEASSSSPLEPTSKIGDDRGQ